MRGRFSGQRSGAVCTVRAKRVRSVLAQWTRGWRSESKGICATDGHSVHRVRGRHPPCTVPGCSRAARHCRRRPDDVVREIPFGRNTLCQSRSALGVHQGDGVGRPVCDHRGCAIPVHGRLRAGRPARA